MPKIVDHDLRRQEVLAAVWRVITRKGIQNTTTRLIAKEAGYSSGVLAHYFVDKKDILASALRLSHRRIRERWESRLEGLHGLIALRELVLDNLPLDEERELETKLEMSFWSRTVSDETFGEVQRAEAAELFQKLESLLLEAREAGEIDPAVDIPVAAEKLLALIDGLSLHSLLYPQWATCQRVVAIIDTELRILAAPPGVGRSTDGLSSEPQGRVAPGPAR